MRLVAGDDADRARGHRGQENHGLDNYFGNFPGANGMAMAHSPNPPKKDPNHRHPAWLTRAKTAPRVQFLEADIPKYWALGTILHPVRLVLHRCSRTVDPTKTPAQFALDAAAGKLPTVSWLYADTPLSEHPPTPRPR